MKKNKKNNLKEKKPSRFSLPEETKRWIWGVVMFLIATIVVLSFFKLSGIAGRYLMTGLSFLIGKAAFAVPLVFILAGSVFLSTKYKKFFWSVILASLIFILGIAGILDYNWTTTTDIPHSERGGWLGYLVALPLLKLFSPLVANIIFGALILVGSLIFWQLLKQPEREKAIIEEIQPSKISLIKKILSPKFKVKEIEPVLRPSETPEPLEVKIKPLEKKPISYPTPPAFQYQRPPLELLEPDQEKPTSGNTAINSAIIKRTLQNFDIPVEMSEINIGPTVTQYTLKPAEGVKLSKITALSNDLALSLASHPIRIEAPIPGRALVGIEVPNKIRAQVRLRNLIDNPDFQKAAPSLTFVLGRDVSGKPLYADLSRMPHLLVAGSTGTGKTIFLNSLILSLLYQSSPEALRFILIDPKRVEFPIYNELPHLFCPVVYDATRAVNALKWLIGEMERRFDLISEVRARDINSYNEMITEMLEAERKNAKKNSYPSDFKSQNSIMPYIVLIIDELADLMAAKGREMEAGIVRLAQMSRAVGIHLVLATQRPSVEVITGLIKANITSRITFQVASQVDSRTVLDMAGAEKLLGRGDLLFVSAETIKPRRIQGSYVSEKEVKKVVTWIKSNIKVQPPKIVLDSFLDLEKGIEGVELNLSEEDPLYEEAKKVVVEARKASASLLQRRLRVGYARAARLIDILEERGVVGPGEGAKPRQVYLEIEENKKEEDWQKI